ncbi:Protein PPP5D1 [Plecturocebus cupreus]
MPRTGLTLLPRLKCSGVITAHYSLHLLDSGDPPTSASQASGRKRIDFSNRKASQTQRKKPKIIMHAFCSCFVLRWSLTLI